MKQLRMTVEVDEETGEVGFKIDGMKSTHGMYVGSTGILVAHDIIEHVNGLEAIGSIGDELMALGAIWEVRGRWGDIVRGNYASALAPEQHIAGELPQLYYHFKRGVPLRWPIPEEDPAFEEHYDLWTDYIAEEGLKMTRGEWMDMDMWDFDSWEEFIEAGRLLFGAGAAKLNELWEDNTLAANSQFWAIHDEVEDHIKRGHLWEGQRYALGYGGGCCSVVELEEDEF